MVPLQSKVRYCHWDGLSVLGLLLFHQIMVNRQSVLLFLPTGNLASEVEVLIVHFPPTLKPCLL